MFKTEVDLSTLLPWRISRRLDTRYGPRVLRVAPGTSEFGAIYLENIDTLRRAGITIKNGVVEWWASPDDVPEDYELTAQLAQTEPLYEYQVPHSRTLKQALDTYKVAFDGSDTGTGKTVCNLVAQCRESGRTPLIICKKGGIAVWAHWCEELNVRYFDIMNYDRVRLGQCEHVRQVRTNKTLRRVKEMVPDDYFLEWVSDCVGVHLRREDLPHVLAEVPPTIEDPRFIQWFEEKKKAVLDRPTPKDMDFRFEFPTGSRPIVIMDEIHKASNYGTVNSRILIAAKKSGHPLAMLSATAADSPLKMDALGFALGLHQKTDFRNWCLANGCVFDRESRQWVFVGGSRALAKIQSNIFPRRGSRMRKADIPGFPKVQITAEPITLGDKVRALLRAYDGTDPHLGELAIKCKDAAGMAAVQRIYILQMSETLKVPFLVEEARDAMNEGYSVVVAVNFNETRLRLMQELETHCAIFGDQTLTQRNACVNAFQTNASRVIVMNIKAGSDSISLNDTQGDHPRIGLICPTDSAIDLKQLFGRLNRTNDASMSQYRIIFAAGTPEDAVCRNVQHKINNIALLNDGDLRAEVQLFNQGN